MSARRILIIDDDLGLGRVVVALLKQGGYEAEHVASGEAGLERLASQAFDVLITDHRMPQMQGLKVVTEAHRRWPGLPIIMLTAHGSVELAVETMKAGAYDFVQKPVDRDDLLLAVSKAMQTALHRADQPETRNAPEHGGQACMQEVRRRIGKAALGEATVLIRGESGTGKSLTARAIHEASPRRAGPFVEVHCGALSDALLHSELFGHERGAFTGAVHKKLGRVAVAQGGTLFLDEIGDTSPSMQLELLNLVQNRVYQPLGSVVPRQADIRIVAATHRDLEDLVARGVFREDLFYRLNVVPIVIPPLRARRDEIRDLAVHFCDAHAQANHRPGARLSAEAVGLLEAQSWPGNVRHLENFVERLVVLGESPEISAVDVRRELTRAGQNERLEAAPQLDERRRLVEREALLEALQRAGNNRSQAARLLGISRRTLYNKLTAHELL